MGNVLIYAEHAHGELPKATAIAVAAGKQVASQSGGETILAVLGSNASALADQASALGTTKVVTVESAALEHPNADVTAKAMKAVADATDSSTVVFASTTTGKDVAPRLLTAMRSHRCGRDAAIIGEVVRRHPGKVHLKSSVGGERVVDMLAGDQLPRIC